MSSPAALLDIARAELGAHEEPPGSNITKYGQFYGLTPAAWCAEFACSYVWLSAGLPVPGDADSPARGWASVQHFLNSARAHGWALPGGAQAAVQPGDFVCFEWEHDSWADHVGIVVATHPDGTFSTIEGNSRGPDGYDEVAYHVRARNVVAGFVRPPYADGGAPIPPVVSPHPPTSPVPPPYPLLPAAIVLRQGSLHTDLVAIYQRQMLHRGWHGIGAVDGLFGPQTRAVTCSFQAEKHLVVDGFVGQQTWRAAFELPVT